MEEVTFRPYDSFNVFFFLFLPNMISSICNRKKHRIEWILLFFLINNDKDSFSLTIVTGFFQQDKNTSIFAVSEPFLLQQSTPPKTNMEPENDGWEDDFPSQLDGF